MVRPKKEVREIASWTSWAALKKGLDENQKHSQLRTFCNVHIYCQKLCWNVWLILLICQCVSPLFLIFHIPLAFLCRSNMVAIHIFRRLVFSARLYMKMASWGFCVLEFDSSGEPANLSEEMVCCVPCSSGAKLLVGRSTSEEVVVGASVGAPMEFPSSFHHHRALW